MIIEVRAEFKSHELEVVNGFGPDPGTVFPDAASKDERVQMAQGSHHGANVTGQAEAKHINGGLRWLMAMVCQLTERAHVVGLAGKTQQAAFLVQDPMYFVSGDSLAAEKVEQARVDISASGSHNQALQRRKAHAGVHTYPIADGCNTAPVAQVGRDDRDGCRCFAQPTGSL